MTFDIDANGILNGHGHGQEHGQGQQDHHHQRQGPAESKEGDRAGMVQEAEKAQGRDEVQRERVSAKNALESHAFNMKSAVEDEGLKGKISGKTRRRC